MPELKLFNTFTRKLEPLYASDGRRLRHYCCGPTVYGPGHIGNFRTFLTNDVLYRTSKLAGLNPLYVRNLTDVDDKTIRDALANGESLRDFTDRWTGYFHSDCERLNMLPPDIEPRATDHIHEQIRLAERLHENGNAYQGSDGSLYYKVDSFPQYGKLSRLTPEDLKTQATNSGGARNLADEYEREQVADFALWKSWKPDDGDNAWESPWGRGRPGWHLECSAMSMKYLGESFDLHSGGEDLCFPHHENEIAQSEAATGKPFVRHWMHTVFLLVDGKKMSKSLGNFYTVQDLIDLGHSPMAIRYALISGHYRKQLNFTLHTLEAAQSGLKRLEKLILHLARLLGWENAALRSFFEGPVHPEAPWGRLKTSFDALLNDLNTPEAIAGAFSYEKMVFSKTQPMVWGEDAEKQIEADLNGLRLLLFALGLKLEFEEPSSPVSAPEEIQVLAQQRWEAKLAKDFATADRLRNQIQDLGWSVLDRKDGFDLKQS